MNAFSMMLLSVITLIALVVCGLALITLLETLLWWYHWRAAAKTCKKSENYQRQDKLIIFLSGTSDYASDNLYSEQVSLLKEINALLVDYEPCLLPFPFQSTTPSWCAKFAFWPQTKSKYVLPLPVIALRNFWQALFLANASSVYSQDIAASLADFVSRYQCREVFFVCGSSGATMAVNSAQLIKQRSGCRIYVACFGGVLLCEEGLAWLDSYVSIDSKQDHWQKYLGRSFNTFTKKISIDGPGHMDYLSPEYRHLVANALVQSVPANAKGQS